MLVKTYGSAVSGIDAKIITIECNVDQGINFYLVGLPDNAVKESQQRIEAALKNVGYKIPGKKIVINMAPADIRKEGSAYDLPIAIGILSASKQITEKGVGKYVIMGELGLDGGIHSIKGVLPIAIQAKRDNFKGIILPSQNVHEAAVVDGLDVFGVNNIKEVIDFFENRIQIPPFRLDSNALLKENQNQELPDFRDVKGQENIKRALEIAAAGGHNVIMIGPPGAGKTMLAKRLATILPPLNLNEALETTKIHSVVGKMKNQIGLVSRRPFRSPHHTISDVALVGGGSHPQPGEISLAHNGVLFLDELPEFKRTALEVLRQPMEDRFVTISRAKIAVDFPSSFMLVASMNPCPCGYYNHPDKECVCAPGLVQKYLSKISGPLLDRIDIHIEVTPVSFDKLSEEVTLEPSCEIRKRVIDARSLQQIRYEKAKGVHCNAQIEGRILSDICALDESARGLLEVAMTKLNLSARAYDRIRKVARTIADLDQSQTIRNQHLAEAIQFRSLDRESWAG